MYGRSLRSPLSAVGFPGGIPVGLRRYPPQPDTKPIIEKIYADVPVEERDRIFAGNAIDYFGLKG